MSKPTTHLVIPPSLRKKIQVPEEVQVWEKPSTSTGNIARSIRHSRGEKAVAVVTLDQALRSFRDMCIALYGQECIVAHGEDWQEQVLNLLEEP